MKTTLCLTVLLLLSLSALGQQHMPTPSASPESENDVVRITTKLVQLDVMVVDKDGKQVRNLSPDDFEILQDGKPQKITNFSYVNTEQLKPQTRSGASDVQVPTAKSTAAARIVTFVVDDGGCSVSTTGVRASREGIEKFVREQMQPNDLVAIYQTRSGSSMLQQYTSDKAQLLKIAHKIQWRPPQGSCSSGDGSLFEAPKSNTFVKQSVTGTTTNTVESGSERKTREHIEDAQENNSVVGTLGVLKYIINGLQRVRGRKVVFFLSDGIPLRERSGDTLSAADVLRDITDLANRSSVVFDTIDARGLIDPYMIGARDQVYGQDDPNATEKITNARFSSVTNSRDGLAFLARETGGEFYKEQNFLDVPIGKALATETGYYLIAYDPSDETFKGKKFNKIEIKVKLPGLKVVSRAGFLSTVDEAPKAKPRKSEDSDLYEALTAPLPSAGLDVKLTAFFVNSPAAGNAVRALFHINGNEITFIDDKGGMKKAVLDVVAVTLDEKNRVVDEFTRGHSFKIEAAAMPYIMKNGLVYSTDVPIQKPGTYNFRVAVKDMTSNSLGSSSQMVEIPDLKKNRIFISGLSVSEVDSNGKFALPAAVKPENALSLVASVAVPATRLFRRGSILAYAYNVYNAHLDPASGQPKLSIQTKLYHNGQLTVDGPPQPAQIDKQADWTQISDYAYMRLTPQMELGDYVIQIIITDLLADGKSAVTSQSVDFEVVE